MNTEHHFCLDESPFFHMMELGSVDSTNRFARNYTSLRPVRTTLITAEYQTAGRGAGTNTWESAEGENLLFSIMVRPETVQPSHVFVLSEALALSVCKALESVRDGFSIKWPNDIYYADRKVAGLLIENDIAGHHISRSVMGVGLNVNQTRFESDAPNPVSLAQIVGAPVERRFVLEAVLEQFNVLYMLVEQQRYEQLHAQYLQRLYRKNLLCTYRDEAGLFQARIMDVEPDGHILLLDTDGRTRRYAFKEVAFVI